jgi:flagellin-like hook-associated protein FlgL
VLHFVRETGELVMHNITANNFPREGVSVTYQKTGFRRGELNPAVYFTAREIIDSTPTAGDDIDRMYRITQYFSRAAGTASGDDYVFTLPFAEYANPDNHEGLRAVLPPGATISGNTVTIPGHLFLTTSNIRVEYFVENPVGAGGAHIKQDLRVAGVELVRALDADGIPVPLDVAEVNGSFRMDNQNLYVEFAMHTNVAINSLASDLLTDKMFADFRRLFQMADSLRISERSELVQHFESLGYTGAELDRVVDNHTNWEYSQARNALQAKFNNMLYLVPRHAENATRQQTLLGARMIRLDLIQDRLEADYVSYNRLMTQNESTDMIEALTRRVTLMAALEGSLRANAGIIQLTLANFIR